MTQQQVLLNKPVKWLTTDYNQLKRVHDEALSIYNGQIKQLFTDAKLVELFQLSNSLVQYRDCFENLKYLCNLSEQMLWDQYQPAISAAGKTKFASFTQDNIHAFYRLKLQSIEAKLLEGGGGRPAHL